MASKLYLKDVINPSHDDKVEVDTGGVTAWLGSGDEVPSGATITSETSASGNVEIGPDVNNTVFAVSFEGAEPVVIDADWSVVTSVDEYYGTEGQTVFDVGMDDGYGPVTQTIEG